MNTDLTTLKKVDDKKKKNNEEILQKWTNAQEELLAEWSEKAACFRWLHSRSEKSYRKKNYSFTIPVIILSTLTGTANFAMDSFVPEEYKTIAMGCVGGVNIFAGILSTLQNFLRYAELMETHRMCEVQWSKFGRNISVELALDPIRRKPANDFLKICRAEYDRLIEQSPPIDDPIINQFKKAFKDSNIKRPDICNGLDKCKIFTPSEDEKKTEIVASAGLKLLEKKKKNWNIPKETYTEFQVIDKLKHTDNKENFKKELDDLKNINKVSSLKNKLKDIDSDKTEININPQDKINTIVKSINQKKDNIDENIEENIDSNKDKILPDIENNLDKELEDNDETKEEMENFLKGINDN